MTEFKRIDFGTVKINKLYTFQLWLTTVILISPIILFGTEFYLNHSYFNNSDNNGAVLIFILFGLIFSLPTLLATYLIFAALTRKHSDIIHIKIAVILVSSIGVLITFLFMGSRPFLPFVCYSASIIICSLFYKVYKR